MKLMMSDTSPPLTVAEIQSFEASQQILLPAEYKQFLLLHNGGKPDRRLFRFNHSAVGEFVGEVGMFFSIDETSTDSLFEYMETYSGRVPTDLLPVARDIGGNLICISVGNANSGQMFFWDHEGEYEIPVAKEVDYRNIDFLATSFDEFVNHLEFDS